MTVSDSGILSAADVLAAAPPLRTEPDARQRIRTANAASGRRIAVLDDDPTGSQAVHGVGIVTAFEAAEFAAALTDEGSTCFILTNTRSLTESDATGLSARVAVSLFELGNGWGAPVDVVSRSDSTLRGHVVAEVRAIDQARRQVLGTGYDGVLLVPAYFEAGRFTAGNIHWATVGNGVVPVGESEFAQDATFGYTSSDLREFVSEKSGGSIRPDEVHTLTLDDIRTGGPDRVASILAGVSGGAFVVVNATDYADLEIVVLGLQQAHADGRTFLHRTGPSFVRALAGLEPQPPLTAENIWPDGNPGGHGLVVVGSHVGLTSRQVAAAQRRGGLSDVELQVPLLMDPAQRDAHVAAAARAVADALAGTDVLLYTSRRLMRSSDPAESLAISRTVSTALIEVVRAALVARPSWVVAKGGITSHDVAVRGFGIRRAEVLGQLLPGMVSVLRPIEAAPEAIGMPYVVFAGNVGDESTLAHVIGIFDGGGDGGGDEAHLEKESPVITVGWIGLGAMGAPMASCIAGAGISVKAYDQQEGKAAGLEAGGVQAVDSIAAATDGVAVLALMVATAAQAETVLFGNGGAAAALAPGAVVLLMATVGPAAAAAIAERLSGQGVQVVDAPVCGGAARAATGDLLMMVSGLPEAVQVVQPLLDAMASNAAVVGNQPGQGQKVKLVNQLLCGVHIAVAAEALAFAESMGLDAGETWEVLRHGAAASFMLDDRGARMVDADNKDIKSTIDIFVKDMGLVTDAARAGAYPAPLAGAAELLFLASRRAGRGRADDSSVIEILRGR